jgi:hypothetical protein
LMQIITKEVWLNKDIPKLIISWYIFILYLDVKVKKLIIYYLSTLKW